MITLTTSAKKKLALFYTAQKNSASKFAILERWDLSELLKRDVTADSPATFEEMLPLWVGSNATRIVDADRIEQYRSYLSKFCATLEIDALLIEIAGHTNLEKITEADLSALHTIIYIETLAKQYEAQNRRLTVLEIGGGYGKIAALLEKFATTKYRYIGIDAVPESCIYSELYLKNQGLDVLAATTPKDMADQSANCIIAPSWFGEYIPADSVDIVVNFSSIQEMPQVAADAYFEAIPKWLKYDGVFLFANSRDFFYQREYQIQPPLYIETKDYSPRSRSLDFPIDVYRKCNQEPPWHKRQAEIDYYLGLKQRLVKKIETVTETNKKLKARIAVLSKKK